MAAVAGSIIGALLSSSSASSNAAAASEAAALQYQIAKRVQDRLDTLFDLWSTQYKACELALKNEVCALKNYVPQYQTVANRALTEVRRQFTRARVDALKCLPLNCVGASCAVEGQLNIAEAGAAAWAMNAAIRTEDLRRDVFNRSIREEKYRMAAFGRQHYMNVNAELATAQMYGAIAASARQAASSSSYGVGRFIQQALGQTNSPARTTPAPIVASQPSVINQTPYQGTIPGEFGDSAYPTPKTDFEVPTAGDYGVDGGEFNYTPTIPLG